MAINIFSGGSGARGGKASKPTTIETTGGKSAVSGIASGAKKVLNFVGDYGSLIPGIGGTISTIAKKLSGNDPEWWENVPGTGVSTNIPLAAFSSFSEGAETQSILTPRPAVLEFEACYGTAETASRDGSTYTYYNPVFWPTQSMVSTYLMQNVRKVINAIPLQDVESYRQVLINQATAYALKHQLDKMIYLTNASQPYLPTMTDGSFQVLSSTSYPTLVGMRDRLAEYCKASVRLPHTMCQYLAWRFGRVYRTGTSSKCGLVSYDVLRWDASLQTYTTFVDRILGFVASNEAPLWATHEAVVYDMLTFSDNTHIAAGKLAAQADLFNAFKDHVIDVQIKPETQFKYDPKEFVLRTNLDILAHANNTDVNKVVSPSPEVIYMDSDLDNKTTFMASTVSTVVTQGPTGARYMTALFPVRRAMAYICALDNDVYLQLTGGNFINLLGPTWHAVWLTKFSGRNDQYTQAGLTPLEHKQLYFTLALVKALEFYNVEIYYPFGDSPLQPLLDMTAMSQDLARVPLDIISNTQTYAFANLVTDAVKSYAAKEMPHAIADAKQVQAEVVNAITPATTTVAPV